MISSLAWRATPARRSRSASARASASRSSPRARTASPARRRQALATRRARARGAPLVRPELLGPAAGALAVAFLIALVYLRFVTAVSAGGYDVHALEARRSELRREVQLLQLEAARLDSPARIESEARRLGLQKVGTVRVIIADPFVAGR